MTGLRWYGPMSRSWQNRPSLANILCQGEAPPAIPHCADAKKRQAQEAQREAEEAVRVAAEAVRMAEEEANRSGD